MGAISRTVLLVVNLLAAILALAVVGITLNALYNPVGKTIPQLQGLPIEIYYSFIVFGAFVFFVSILGVIGTCIHSKVFLSLFVVFDILLALAFLIVAIFALIYSNGISTVNEIDSNAQKFQALIEKNLYEQATKKPDVWNVTQATLGCCGVDLESTYANITELGVASLPAFLDILQPGPKCAAGRDAVVAIHGTFATYSADAEAAADANAALKNYFCKDIISSFLAKNTLYAGIISAVLVLIMISTAASAIILMTKVTTVNGGFVPPPTESGNSLAYGSAKKGGPQVNTVSVGNTLA